MFAQADWAPTQSPDAITRVNGFINRAYNQLMLEAPFLFFESEVRLALEPDVASLSDSDLIQMKGTNTVPGTAAADRWTFKTTYSPTTQTANSTLYTEWKTDRSWDGRTIEITDTDGTVYRNQIRHVWLDSTDASSANYRWNFTLVHPWINGLDNRTFKYRIYTEEYALPDDLVEMKSTRIFDQTLHYPVQVVGQQEAEERSLLGARADVASGIPRVMFRRKHVSLPGPSSAPDVGLDDRMTATQAYTNAWKGPEPPGEFEYAVTYTWGKRDVEFRLPGLAHWRGSASVPEDTMTSATAGITTDPSAAGMSTAVWDFAAQRYREPRYESPPSPKSDAIKVPDYSTASEGSPAIKLTLPNIEHALGFFNSFGPTNTYLRRSDQKSGVYVRIYRRRKSSNFDQYEMLPYAAAGLRKMDEDTGFYLLAEMPVDHTNEGYFYDNGEIIPDRSRRLRDINGYQTFATYPRPDKRYVLDVRCVRRPSELEDDEDAPLLHAEAVNVLIQRAMVLLYENMGNPSMSQLCMVRYREELLTLSKRYGDLRPPGVAVLRRMTRARFGYRGATSYRKWYQTPS